jgi:hypothetical protein
MPSIDVITRIRDFNDSAQAFDRQLMDALLAAQDQHRADFRVVNFELGYGPQHELAVRAFLEASVNSGNFISYVFSERTSPDENVGHFLEALAEELSSGAEPVATFGSTVEFLTNGQKPGLLATPQGVKSI